MTKRDLLEKYSDIYLSGDKSVGEVFLTSGFLPPFYEYDLYRQIDTACNFQSYATGGSVLHIFLGERLTLEQKKNLVESLTKLPLQYFTLTTVLTTCNECKAKMFEKTNICRKCGSADVTFWTRPVGYFRPVMRKNISNDFTSAEYEFSLRSRIREYSTRRIVSVEDVEDIISEITSNV